MFEFLFAIIQICFKRDAEIMLWTRGTLMATSQYLFSIKFISLSSTSNNFCWWDALFLNIKTLSSHNEISHYKVDGLISIVGISAHRNMNSVLKQAQVEDNGYASSSSVLAFRFELNAYCSMPKP